MGRSALVWRSNQNRSSHHPQKLNPFTTSPGRIDASDGGTMRADWIRCGRPHQLPPELCCLIVSKFMRVSDLRPVSQDKVKHQIRTARCLKQKRISIALPYVLEAPGGCIARAAKQTEWLGPTNPNFQFQFQWLAPGRRRSAAACGPRHWVGTGGTRCGVRRGTGRRGHGTGHSQHPCPTHVTLLRACGRRVMMTMLAVTCESTPLHGKCPRPRHKLASG